MKLLHYTSNKIEKLKKSDKINHFKPTGLWLSVNDEWSMWCEDNQFYTYDNSNYWLYEYSIDKSANIIILQNVNDVYNFTNKYYNNYRINWNEVYKNYDGIGFLNYQKIKSKIDVTIELSWYYSIDINCYCIWNFSILKEITVTKNEPSSEEFVNEYYNCD